MSELRWHPLVGQWVITATERQERTFLPPKDYCPLCPTQPGAFPTEISEPSYDIVTFENKFPSLRPSPPVPAIQGTDFEPVRPAGGQGQLVGFDALQRGAKLAAFLARRRPRNRQEHISMGLRRQGVCVHGFLCRRGPGRGSGII